MMLTFAVVGHDAKIGNGCSLGCFSFMGGYSELEDFVMLHPSAHINPHKKVGEGAVVGTMSVVIRNVKPHITVYGNPAVKLEM